ncbi:MAG: hypothetical protein WDO73_03775 [Ignavibacteriota bacterium]
MVNRFYGRGDLPVGAAIKTLKGGAQDGYMSAALRTAGVQVSGTAEPAPVILRRLLTNSRNKVIIVQTGFSSNLAALLDSPDGAALAKEKSPCWRSWQATSPMARPSITSRSTCLRRRQFSNDGPRLSFSVDSRSARPSLPRHQYRSRLRLRQPAPHSGILSSLPEDAVQSPHLDLTAALQAIRPITTTSRSRTLVRCTWSRTASPVSPSAAVIAATCVSTPANRAEILEALALLASEPPHRR